MIYKVIVLTAAVIVLVALKTFASQGDYIISRFHQTDYLMKDTWIEVASYDPDYFYMVSVKTFKFNRTTTAFNFTSKLKVDLDLKNTDALVKSFKFVSNEYRNFPIQYRLDVCKLIRTNAAGMSDSIMCGNLSLASCFYSKNVLYHACNFLPDITRLPPMVPSGRYKVIVAILQDDRNIFTINVFGEIYRPLRV